MRAEDSEILSVVDDQDQVIGQRRRDDIHRLGLVVTDHLKRREHLVDLTLSPTPLG